MRLSGGLLFALLLIAASTWSGVGGVADSKPDEGQKQSKFREREATDDTEAHPNPDEDSLLNTKCPHNVELRWQTEVRSSIYATPLIADINSDGKLEVVVPSFVHYLEVLEGADGDKLPGWPAFHQSTVHASPLLYDIDKDGTKEIALATYNGVVNFFRSSGYMMMDKLEVPRRRVHKNWYVGLYPDPVDHSRPDVHDESIVQEASIMNSVSNMNGSLSRPNISTPTGATAGSSTNLSKSVDEVKHDSNLHSLDNTTAHDVSLGSAAVENSGSQRKLLEDTQSEVAQERASESHEDGDTATHAATVQNDQDLEEDAASSFDLFRDAEELPDEYNYDYDDYVDESKWGDEDWAEAEHEKMEDYVNIDSHILCTPVIADIDNDGVQEMIVAASYFFDREYYDNPAHLADLGGIDIDKYVASGIVVFNLDTKQVKWTSDLDLSTDTQYYRAHIYSSPTVVDLDGDGYLDILVGTSFGLVYVLDHRGKVREHFPLEMAVIQGPVAAADINDDGKIEIVATDTNGNVAAWTAQGEEIWEVHLKSLIPQSEHSVYTSTQMMEKTNSYGMRVFGRPLPRSSVYSFIFSKGPTIGDINGDGRTEIVVPTASGNIYVLSGKDGSYVSPFPYRTYGRVMSQVLLVDLSKRGEKSKGLTLVTTSFDGYLYFIDGSTACADVVDIGETSYSMVLADNVDGGDDLDLIVATMNGNVFCFSTPSPHHPLKEWKSLNQGRNNVASRYNREGIFVSHASRAFRDEEGKNFWVELEIVDNYRVPSGSQGPYNVTTSLLVPGNYQGERRIVVSQVYDQPGKHRIKLPTVPVRTTGTVLVEMVDKNGLYFSDEFCLTFHMHYYKLLKWLVLLPMVGMFGVLVILRPQEGAPLPSFSRSID